MLAGVNFTTQAAILGGFVPIRLTGGLEEAGFLPAWITPLTYALLHGSLMHLGLNLLMLVICGTAVEKAIGKVALLVLYIAGALAAAAAQWGIDPNSPIPVIGASGAISAIVGAYALLFGQSRVRAKNPIVARALHILWLAAAWVGLQLLLGFASSGENGPSIAIVAHIGGFIAGLALIRPLLNFRWRHA